MFQLKDTNILGVKSKIYECGFCKDEVEELLIPWEVYAQWLFISQKMGDKEWGCVFVVKDGQIESYKIPEQEVSGSICEFKEDNGGNGIMHSHHNMGAFHSHQDDLQARNLYDYSIVLSTMGYDACHKVKLPCGGYGYKPVLLKIAGCELPSLEPIKEKRFEVKEANVYPVDKHPRDRFHEHDSLLFDDVWESEGEPPVCPNCFDPLGLDFYETGKCDSCGAVLLSEEELQMIIG